MTVADTTAQVLVITDWLPAPLVNGPRGHWSSHQRKLRGAQIMVWAAAKQENLRPVAGRAVVTITLVFSQKRRRDTDNLYARVKGVVDGLVKGGWIEDDSTDVLDLRVAAEVRPGQKATEIRLGPAGSGASTMNAQRQGTATLATSGPATPKG